MQQTTLKSYYRVCKIASDMRLIISDAILIGYITVFQSFIMFFLHNVDDTRKLFFCDDISFTLNHEHKKIFSAHNF